MDKLSLSMSPRYSYFIFVECIGKMWRDRERERTSFTKKLVKVNLIQKVYPNYTP